MTLNEAKIVLSENNIPFELCEFENEAAYWHHIALFPYTKNAKDCKVMALIIPSNNQHKNIELQFNATDTDFLFIELRFGEYGFDMFDDTEDVLADDMLNRIFEIRSGHFVVMVKNDLKHKRWMGDACFELKDDELFGKSGFEKAINCIHKPKGLLAKLFKSKIQYEIYDWNSYQCILK